MGNMKIRMAKLTDAEKILEIYAYYVEHTAVTFEYEVPSLEEFKSRMENVMKKYPYLVAEEAGKIVGYAYASPFHERAAYGWGVEMTVYIKHDIRCKGYGKQLYQVLEDILKKQNILNANACIGYTEIEDEHLTNKSKGFHEHLGYRLVGEFHQCGYKFGKWYNMIWMEKMLGEHTVPPKPVIPIQELADCLDFLNLA